MPNLQLGNLLTAGNALLAFPNKYSFNFDGSNDYLNCGNTSLELSAQISLSFWAKNDSSGLSSSQYITSQYDYNSNQRAFRIFFNSDEIFCSTNFFERRTSFLIWLASFDE